MMGTVQQLKEERLLSAREFAELLGVSKRKVYEIWASGSIAVVTIGRKCRRVRLADALAWIAARRA